MGLKNKISKFFDKESHLINYLEDEFNVQIIKKYDAFLIISKGTIINYLFSAEDVKEFLENGYNAIDILEAKSAPKEVIEKFEEKEAEEVTEEEPSKEEAEALLEGKTLETRRTEEPTVEE